MIAWACAALISALAGFVALLASGWGGALTRAQRLGLGAFSGGLAWAGVNRMIGRAPGVADLLWLIGLLIYFLATHGRQALRSADKLDGVEDGRLDVTKLFR